MKQGSSHWLSQRLSAVVLLFLLGWFSCQSLYFSDYVAIRFWFSSTFNATMMILLTGTSFYHGYLGVEMIIEDYIRSKKAYYTCLTLFRFSFILLSVLCIMLILKLCLKP